MSQQGYSVVGADGPGVRQHADDRAARRARDRDVDPAAAVGAGAGAGRHARGAGGAVAHRACAAALRAARSYQIRARRLPSTPAFGTIRLYIHNITYCLTFMFSPLFRGY